MKKKDESYKTIMVPCVSVNPNYICLYGEPADGRNYNSSRFNENKKNLANNNHSGIISVKASKRINQALSWFAELSKEKIKTASGGQVIRHKLAFITLTLSDKQKHSDQFIKQRMLNWFLNDLKKRFVVTSYLWRAEAQENGNIHFHIVINRFVHHKAIREIWNNIQSNFGYLDNYKKQYGADKQPPSTEIKAVYKCRNIAGYLSKYVSKDVALIRFQSDSSQALIKESLKGLKVLSVFKNDKTNQVRIKFDPTHTGYSEIENTLKNQKILFTNFVRVQLRAIKGRLWFLSQTMKRLKNTSKQLTTNFASELIHNVKNGIVKAKEIITDHARVFVFNVSDYFHLDFFNEIKKMFFFTEIRFTGAECYELARHYWQNKK